MSKKGTNHRGKGRPPGRSEGWSGSGGSRGGRSHPKGPKGAGDGSSCLVLAVALAGAALTVLGAIGYGIFQGLT